MKVGRWEPDGKLKLCKRPPNTAPWWPSSGVSIYVIFMLNLKNLSEDEIRDLIRKEGLENYRADQLIQWIYERQISSLEEITVFSRTLRKELSSRYRIGGIRPVHDVRSEDGTRKFLFELEDGETVESVLIPDGNRLTLCISSQVGCAMGCRFCVTGSIGLRRNLAAWEIVDQFIQTERVIGKNLITNIVLMGMGEPLHNIIEVREALNRMVNLLKISKRRITLSTSGYLKGLEHLVTAGPLVNLAVSLNATDDRTRTSLMPVNRQYPLKTLICKLREYPLEKRRRITIEYIMIDGVNDSLQAAEKLYKLLKGIPVKINLIPFNPSPSIPYRPSPPERIFRFQELLIKKGMTVLLRKSKGGDILAACGQLKAGYK